MADDVKLVRLRNVNTDVVVQVAEDAAAGLTVGQFEPVKEKATAKRASSEPDKK